MVLVPLAMPVNVRAPSDSKKAANQWSAATLAAPVGIGDPVERMKKVRELVLTARSDSNLNAAAMIAPIVNWIPNSVIGSFATGALGIDVQASNVPGHPRPRYLAGARIVRSVPIGPAPGVALMIAMISLDGGCHVGLRVGRYNRDECEQTCGDPGDTLSPNIDGCLRNSLDDRAHKASSRRIPVGWIGSNLHLCSCSSLSF